MAKHGKKYIQALQKVEKGKEYSLMDAVALIKEISYTKFIPTLEGHFNVKYKSLQNVRGVLQLPHGTGRQVKVLVFAKGEKADEARAAGADFVGDEDLIAKVQEGWTDFDAVVATPDMMKEVGRLGPVLGKRGLMPKPKSGTVTFEVASIVKELKAGRFEYRADKTGVIHIPMGKLSFSNEQLVENAQAAFTAILRDKPSDAKGEYVTAMYLAATMSPAVRVNIRELR
ncbi:MAG: 50S ribosomal protein L1 [Leptospiraceae bacterium]|nr:50S ribosomal protein L1 [Leptospiraceae bacterium]MDW8305575.1 50S ribosomal protein L1 [Leptospiraceae bacterium]